MNKIKLLSLASILLISLSFRLYINYFLPINQPMSWLIIFFGLINLILIFSIVQKLINYEVAITTAFLYAISPWTSYLEISANPYVLLLTLLLVLCKLTQLFNVSNKIFLGFVIILVVGFLYKFNQISVFSNVGLINTVNEFRGETNQTIFAPLGRIIENRYIYLSEHLIFNILKQFTPATYFTNQVGLLGFSFTPPVFLGFLIPFLFGLNILIRQIKKGRFLILSGVLLLLPSVISKNSPDLSRLILIAPVVFLIISTGIYEFAQSYKKRMLFRVFAFITIFLVALQFFSTLSDIQTREPVRLQEFLNHK